MTSLPRDDSAAMRVSPIEPPARVLVVDLSSPVAAPASAPIGAGAAEPPELWTLCEMCNGSGLDPIEPLDRRFKCPARLGRGSFLAVSEREPGTACAGDRPNTVTRDHHDTQGETT